MLRALFAFWAAATLALAARAVEGTVRNASTGAPIDGARVRLTPEHEDGKPYTATTDAAGRFRIDDVEAGTYRVSYRAGGFGFYPDIGVPAPVIAVGGGIDPVKLEVQLKPVATISGRVLDGDGRPLANTFISLYNADRWCKAPACLAMHLQGKTDGEGRYSMANLPTGTWIVAAGAPSGWRAPEGMVWGTTYFPGVGDAESAQPFAVKPGVELTGIDIRLKAVAARAVRGIVLDAGGRPAVNAQLALWPAAGSSLTSKPDKEGRFEFAPVWDGEWRLVALMKQGVGDQAAGQVLEVRGRDLEDVEVRLAAPFTVRGRAVIEAPEGIPAPPLPKIDVMLVTGAVALSASVAVAKTDGFELKNVHPGKYMVQLMGDQPAPYYLAAIRLGRRDAIGEEVAIASGDEELTLVYKLGGGTVRGTVEGCGSPHVLLVPEDRTYQRMGFVRVTECDARGRFEFAAVRPGEYYAFTEAATPLPSLAAVLADAAKLRSAARVTVRTNEATAVEVK